VTVNPLTCCGRCERLFFARELNIDGLCNSCHNGIVPPWAVAVAKELQQLPPEADLRSWAERIAHAAKKDAIGRDDPQPKETTR